MSARSAESGVVITLAGTQSPHNRTNLIRRWLYDSACATWYARKAYRTAIPRLGQGPAGRGEFKERERAGTLRRSTRRTGRFEYRTLLPGDANAEGVNAALRDGVLTITVPKAETTKPRHIQITAGD
ncbi:Hsp20/alpha crystallin family protein [Streptomyces jeddahensis]|uniref:Hsp20/alpha crystallin family protein n=1 Tax=Streptomyces jeddahensis TaxID=1716141 RepID=A0A177HTW7_9ACTN|nr:Hsp20/alpha crystallin family protein [Streptomyces jeddahensis]